MLSQKLLTYQMDSNLSCSNFYATCTEVIEINFYTTCVEVKKGLVPPLEHKSHLSYLIILP